MLRKQLPEPKLTTERMRWLRADVEGPPRLTVAERNKQAQDRIDDVAFMEIEKWYQDNVVAVRDWLEEIPLLAYAVAYPFVAYWLLIGEWRYKRMYLKLGITV
jgi:hypothetical protein